jgi:hypothetical protein
VAHNFGTSMPFKLWEESISSFQRTHSNRRVFRLMEDSMRDLIRGVLALLLLSLVWLPSSAAGPSAEAVVLVDDFVRSFNAHDAKGFGLLFTDDADWVSVAGIRVKGRTNDCCINNGTVTAKKGEVRSG